MGLIPETPSPVLPDGHSLLSIAALFDREFSMDWIVELTGTKASQVLRGLEDGCQQGWCVRKETGIFQFNDPKKQDELLESLTPEKREWFRRRILELLKRDLSVESEKAMAMAPHLLKIEDGVEYARWLVKAGDLYRQGFQTELALQCYAKVLNQLSRAPGGDLDQVFIDTAIQYSKISTARHSTGEVIAILKDALRKAQKGSKRASQSLLEMHLAKNEWLCSRYQSAMRHFERGWLLAREIDDPKVLRSIATFSTFFLYWQGRFQEAVRSYEKSVSDVVKFPQGRFPLLAGMTIGQCYAYTGQLTQGLGMLDAIRVHCLERGDRFLLANAEGTMGGLLLDIRRVDEALEYLEKALENACREHNYLVQILGNLTLACAQYLLGHPQRSIIYLCQFLDLSKKVKMTVQIYPCLMELCWAMEHGSLPRVAGLSLRDEIQRSLRGNHVFMKGIAFRYWAMIQRIEGAVREKILHPLQLSLKWLQESGHRIELARTQLELARHYLLGEEEEKAREMIQSAYPILSPLNESLIPDDLKALVQTQPVGEKLLKEILKLGQEVVTIRDNQDLVQHILTTGNKITGAERGAIFLLKEGNLPSKLNLRASKNLTSEQISQPAFSPSWKLIEEVARSGKGRTQGSRLEGAKGDPRQDFIRSCICVPMILRDKIVGVLYYDNRLLSSAFKESDLELLAYFGALAAFALDKAVSG